MPIVLLPFECKTDNTASMWKEDWLQAIDYPGAFALIPADWDWVRLLIHPRPTVNCRDVCADPGNTDFSHTHFPFTNEKEKVHAIMQAIKVLAERYPDGKSLFVNMNSQRCVIGIEFSYNNEPFIRPIVVDPQDMCLFVGYDLQFEWNESEFSNVNEHRKVKMEVSQPFTSRFARSRLSLTD